MIVFNNISNSLPLKRFKEKYNLAEEKNQADIQAACISSFNPLDKSVSSRFVNIKFVETENFIFFSNYESQKAKEFDLNSKISVIFYWSTINTQVRIKAIIEKTSKEFNQEYFVNRSPYKNALAISSEQSNKIKSYEEVKSRYEQVLNNEDLFKCPSYWGGYICKPFEMEFWEGDKYRLNKRNFYTKNNNGWDHHILQP